jgi:hypothetical protein
MLSQRVTNPATHPFRKESEELDLLHKPATLPKRPDVLYLRET